MTFKSLLFCRLAGAQAHSFDLYSYYLNSKVLNCGFCGSNEIISDFNGKLILMADKIN